MIADTRSQLQCLRLARVATLVAALAGAASGYAEDPFWTSSQIPGLTAPVERLIPHPSDPDLVLAVDDSGDTWRTADGGTTWEKVATRAEQVAFAPSDPSRVYLFRQANGDSPLRVSRDGGRSFEPVGFPQTEIDGITEQGGLLNLTFLALAVDPSDADTVYVGNSRFFFSGGIIVLESSHFWKTLDGGGTWGDLGGEASAIAVDLRDPRVVYRGSSRGLRISHDGGRSFGPLRVFSQLGAIDQIVVDPLRPATLWLLNGEDAVRSDDGGRTAVSVTSGLPEGTIRSLVASSVRDGEVFATVSGAVPHGSRDRGDGWGSLPGALGADRFTGALAQAADGRLWAGAPDGVLRLDREPFCLPTDASLCLQQSRFRVEATWRDFQGGRGVGHSRRLTPDTGAFWFFEPDNLEVTVKVLDGRPINGHFWVFLGSMSNVSFSVTVIDITTGAVWRHDNPAGTFASTGDPHAFPDSLATP